MPTLAIFFALFLIIGSVLGWVAFLKINSLRQQIDLLRKQVKSVSDRIDTLRQHGVLSDTAFDNDAVDEEKEIDSGDGVPVAASTKAELDAARDIAGADPWLGDSEQGSYVSSAKVASVTNTRGRTDSWFNALKDQWMIWLGGLSISLAGIFLVRYSIEQGLLGPMARVILGVGTGLGLHGAAEWLRRHNVGHYNAFAALAGGASITLYAALLAALLLYELLNPLVVFALLAVVSLLTMSLALVHGPVLAILGILGAYIVPLLVDTGSDSILGLYIYSLIITAAAILLMRRIYRPWLWAGMLSGSLGWWFVSTFSVQAEGYRGYYLAALAYLILAMPFGDWLLRGTAGKPAANESPQFPLTVSTGLIVLALGFGVSIEPSIQNAVFYWTPISVILLLAGGSRVSLRWIPIAALIVQLAAWFARGLESNGNLQLIGLPATDHSSFLFYAAWMTAVYCALSAFNYLNSRSSLWIATLVLTPLAWLSLSYLLVSDLVESVYWGTVAMVLGMAYLLVAWWRLKGSSGTEQDAENQVGLENQVGVENRIDAKNQLEEINTAWLITAGHFAYSLAVTIMVREATLTLALAAQVVSLTWLMRKFHLPQLDLLIKAVLGVIVARLTLNPWLLSYPQEIHWSLWTYGGSTALTAVACRLASDNQELRRWLEATTLHLLVLTLWAETRYWLYDGNIFAPRFELLEFAINTAVWSTLALVYHRRHQVSTTFRLWYRFSSRVLLLLSIASYALVLLPLNPIWGGRGVSSTPVFNELLLAYGYPIVISVLLYRFYESRFQRFFAYGASFTGFVFINLEIRHLWQGTVSLSPPAGNGELYTYTITWLVLAIVALLAGSIRYGKTVYKGGMALLMLVVAKIFLVDMADLEGLLRVTSFMGLGLSLLGLAYLYQRFNLAPNGSEKE